MGFIGFSYIHQNKVYVEAIPDWGNPDFVIQYLPSDIPWLTIFAPSRNRARRRMYEIAVDASGVGFNRMPLSPIKGG